MFNSSIETRHSKPPVANYCDTWCTRALQNKMHIAQAAIFKNSRVFNNTWCNHLCAFHARLFFFAAISMNFPRIHTDGFRVIYLSILSDNRYRFFLAIHDF